MKQILQALFVIVDVRHFCHILVLASGRLDLAYHEYVLDDLLKSIYNLYLASYGITLSFDYLNGIGLALGFFLNDCRVLLLLLFVAFLFC